MKNTVKRGQRFLMVLALVLALPVWAADDSEKARQAEQEQEMRAKIKQQINWPEDKTNYQSDVVKLRIDSVAKKLTTSDPDAKKWTTDGTVCVPASSLITGISLPAKVTESVGIPFMVTELAADSKECAGDKQKITKAGKGDLILVDADSLPAIQQWRRGWSYGTLVTPFKYYVGAGGAGMSTNGATVAGYIGGRFPTPIWDFNPELVVFAGFAPVRGRVLSTGAETDSTALSTGFAFLGTLKGAYNFGVVFGTDRVGSETTFNGDGKWWVSFGLGYSFAQ